METRQFPSVQILQLMEQQCLAHKQHQAVKDLRDRGGFWEIQVQELCLAMMNWSLNFKGRYTDKVESYRSKGVIKPLTPAWDINVYSKCWQKNVPLDTLSEFLIE